MMKRLLGVLGVAGALVGTAACGSSQPATVHFSDAGASAPVASPAAPASSTAQATPATLVSTSPSSASDTRRDCDEGRWSLTVQGQPRMFSVGGPAGYYLWHDQVGWHLRTTTPSAEHHTFSGTVASTDNIRLVHDYHDEKADTVNVRGNVVEFRFDTHNRVDGFDFVVGCTESVTFDFRGEGHQWPAQRIWLGRTGRAPSDPFTESRVG